MMLRRFPLPRVKSHVVWNYKGGVGKTTLIYHMATEYARSHPFETVLVIDLSPQPNASLALLGSLNALNVLMSQEKTISFCLHLANSGCFPCPENYLTHVSFFNNKIPGNIKLLCGDIYGWSGFGTDEKRIQPWSLGPRHLFSPPIHRRSSK